MYEDVIDKLNKARGITFVQTLPGIFDGDIFIRGNQMKLRIDLGGNFPNSFPDIYILDPKSFVPHASQNGKLCLVNEENIIVCPHSEHQLVLDAFDKAIEILEMDSEQRKNEIFREFIAHWTIQSKAQYSVHLNLPDADQHEFKGYTAVAVESKKIIIVSETVAESDVLLSNSILPNIPIKGRFTIECIRIRLRCSVLPPLERVLEWRDIKKYIINNITGGQKKLFKKFISKQPLSLTCMFIIQIPSPYGDQTICVLATFDNPKHESLNNIDRCKIDAITPYRIDQKYLLLRGGAGTDLTNKKVLLIGCGSIGGYIAENLCQCGIGSLDILDEDRLSFDNVHRHILGFSDASAGEFKADLMKKHLEAKFPYIDIDSLNYDDRSAESFINDISRLNLYDLIISATGNPSINLMINDKLHENDCFIPYIVCFNEPFGIGGHAIALLKDGACLRCFYTDMLSGELTPFQASFVERNQSFTKTLSGCSGTYVEYSVLDSQQTATMTTRLVLQVLRGECFKTRMISWVGDSSLLTSAGFQVSKYYKKLALEGKTSVSSEISKVQRCQTCGK